MELFKSSYYWLDLLVGFGSPILLYVLVRKNVVGRRDWKLFWIGAAIGLSWELPIFMLSALSSYPVIIWLRPLPLNWVIFMICHTLWDGAIFLVGVWLVQFCCKRPILTQFRWPELLIMVIWGQISAFLVEFSSVTNDAWVYVEGYWWNPTAFRVGPHPITIIIQIAWFFAPILFYFAALKISSKGSGLKPMLY